MPVLNFLASALGSAVNYQAAMDANKYNQSIARENIAYQREANAQNIAFQQRENEITRAREDNAVQRAAQDMTAAGLSKTLAAGNPASAASMTAPKTQALNNSFKYQNALDKVNLGSLFLDAVSKAQQIDINRDIADAQIDYYANQSSYLQAVAAGQNLSNDTYMDRYHAEMEFKFADTAYKYAQTAATEAQTDLYKTEGKYRAELIMSEISRNTTSASLNLSNVKLNNSNINKIGREISEIIARTYNLDKTGQKLVEEITYAQLQNKAMEHNIAVADEYNYPVGVYPSGLVNYIDRTGKGASNSVFGSDAGDFLFNWSIPNTIKYMTSPEHTELTNPGKTRKFIDWLDKIF